MFCGVPSWTGWTIRNIPAETISALSRDAIAGHFLAHYRPPNLVLAAAGNLHHDAVAAGLERRMSPAPGQRPVRDGFEFGALHLCSCQQVIANAQGIRHDC